MSVKFSNNGHSTLASSLTSSGTSITVASGHGSRFPSLSSGEHFYATLIDSSNNLEIVKVTARSSDVLTATRAQESTTARAFAIGDRIELRVTAQGLTDLTTVNLDGDKGDITVSSDGATWSIDSNVVGADELNVSGNGSAGQYLESDGDGTMTWSTVSAVVRKIHTFRNSTRTAVGNSANNNVFSFGSFTPLDAANNSFIVHVTVPTNHTGNDFGSHGVRFEGTSNTYDFNLRGVMHIDVGGPHMSVEGQHYFIAAGEMAQQTFTCRWRYYAQDSNPDAVNPNNSSDNSRINGQTSSELIIIEYKNA